MPKLPSLFSPQTCFLAGIIVSIVFGSMQGPPPPENLSIGTALFSALFIVLSSALMFWFAVERRPAILFLLFCGYMGNLMGVTGLNFYQDVDGLFVLVRAVASFIGIGFTYQYFVKKIKK